MMRNPNRIQPLLMDISNVWEQCFPDWRFMQVICNFQQWLNNDGYYIEDDKLLEKFCNFASNLIHSSNLSSFYEDCKTQNIGEWNSYVFDGPPGMRPTTFVCSNCNCISPIKTNYCCHCGKQMKE